MRHAASDALVPNAGVGAKRPASPCGAARPTRMLRSREAAAGTQSADPAHRASAEGMQVAYRLDEHGWPIDPATVAGAVAGAVARPVAGAGCSATAQ